MARWTAQLLNDLTATPLEDGGLWNINLPHLPPGELAIPERVTTKPCRLPLNVGYEDVMADDIPLPPGQRRLKYTARYADRPVEPGSDVEACFGGRISVSRLRL